MFGFTRKASDSESNAQHTRDTVAHWIDLMVALRGEPYTFADRAALQCDVVTHVRRALDMECEVSATLAVAPIFRARFPNEHYV